jgi:proline dehydrogenase
MNLRERFVEILPQQALRIFARPYVAGVSMEEALAKARDLARLGVASTIDILGEDVAKPGDIEVYSGMYIRLVEAIASDARLYGLPDAMRPSISLKPSMFVMAPKDENGMIRDPGAVRWDDCEAAITRVLAVSAAANVRATIDMENHQWTDATLAIYKRAFARYGMLVGTVLQSRLHRTAQDIEELPDGCRIRLCIGIYNEPAEFATRDMHEMKAKMIPMAKRLLEKNVFLEFATHDQPLIARFVREVIVPMGIGPNRFETQTLLGVPRDHLIGQLTSGSYFVTHNGSSTPLRQGIVHRMYVPFADQWDQALAYSRRRLRHSPSLFWTGLVNAPRVMYYWLFRK